MRAPATPINRVGAKPLSLCLQLLCAFIVQFALIVFTLLKK